MTQHMAHRTQIALKKFQKQLLATTAMTMAVMLSVTAAHADPAQYDLPTGFSLQNGTVAAPVLTGANNEYMTLTQDSNRAVINWNTFNVGSGATVHFQQNGTAGVNSVTVNRVTNGTINRSEIFGTLKANGRIMILDRNGVLFGSTAKTDVSGIIASTGELDAENTTRFMNGQTFDLNNIDSNPNGSITNNATLSIKDSGLLAFVAPYVQNNGTINAKLGRVVLAAGKKVTVDFAGDELIQLAVDDGLAGALVENSETGRINARGGRVTLTANAASTVVDNVINMKGVIKANSFSVNNGKIVLSSKGGGKINVSGELDVSRPASEGGVNKSAGNIIIEAKNIVITATAKLLANLVNEQSCFLIFCSTVGKGNGGTVDIAATEDLIFRGKIDATGGAQSGNIGTARFFGGNSVTVDSSEQMNANLSIRSNNTISFLRDFTMKSGTFDLYDAVTINLDGKLKRQGLVFAALMGQDELDSIAGTVNILSDKADIMQGIHLSRGGEDADVNVASGTYLGNLNIYKTLNLLGHGTESAPVNLFGTNIFAASVVDINAEDVVFDGFHVSGLNQNGVTSYNQTDVTVSNNTFTGFILGSGILINGGKNAILTGNSVLASKNGITLVDHENAKILGNNITGMLHDGIHVDNGDNLTVAGNIITGAANEGIHIESTEGALLTLNAVLGAAIGVNLTGVEDVTLLLNAIGGTSGDALFVDHADNLNIFLNAIGLSGGHALNLQSVSNTNVGLNLIGGTGGDGIHVNFGSNVLLGGNVILDAGANGISAIDVTDVKIIGNFIHNAGNDGIFIDPTTGYAMFNVITGAGNNGITIASSPYFHAKYNYISGAGNNGVEVIGSDNAWVTNNRIVDSTNNGVSVSGSNFVLAGSNWISGSGSNGVYMNGGFANNASLNVIWDSGANGIYFDGSDESWITGNKIFGSDENGIRVSESDTSYLLWNLIAGSEEDGIHLDGTSHAYIVENRIYRSGDDGIEIDGGETNQISFNKVRRSGSNGIRVSGNRDVNIAWNNVKRSGHDGINVTGVYYEGEEGETDNIRINNNTVKHSGNDGISLYETNGATIRGNTVTFFEDDGVQVAYSGNVRILKNTIDGSGYYPAPAGLIEEGPQEGDSEQGSYYNPTTGIRIGSNEDRKRDGGDYSEIYVIGPFSGDFSGGYNIDVTGNTVSNTGVGLSARAFNNGYINVAGNTFTDNTVGMWVGSGLIDMTGETNTFTGGDVAIRFERAERTEWTFPDFPDFPPQEGSQEGPQPLFIEGPFLTTVYADLALVGDTIGTTVFKGQSSYYVDLQNGALFDPGTPTLIDGTQATYDGVFGGLMTPAQLKAIEDKINDYDDNKTLGQIFAGFTTLDDNQIFKKIFGNNYKSGKAGIVINNRPNTGGQNNGNRFFSVQDLANLEPAAGGDDPSPNDLANLEPAAGGDEPVDGKCWSNATGMGGVVSLDLSSDESAILSDKSACTGDI